MTNAEIADDFVNQYALIDRSRVAAITGLSKLTIQRLEEKGRFPRRYRLGAKRIAYRITDVEAWLKAAQVA